MLPRERYYRKKTKKNTTTLRAKKAIKYVTQRRKNQVLKKLTDLTGSNKVPTLDKSPLVENPPNTRPV